MDQLPESSDEQKINLRLTFLVGAGVLVLIVVLGLVITRSIRKNP